MLNGAGCLQAAPVVASSTRPQLMGAPRGARAGSGLCSRRPCLGKPCWQRADEDTNQPFRFKEKAIHANEKCFHLIKYPLTDTFAGSILICWWWIPWPSPPVEMVRSTVSENCFDESQVCQFDFNRKIGRKYLSYDCAGFLRMHECSFCSSHLIQVSRTENGMRNMGMI